MPAQATGYPISFPLNKQTSDVGYDHHDDFGSPGTTELLLAPAVRRSSILAQDDLVVPAAGAQPHPATRSARWCLDNKDANILQLQGPTPASTRASSFSLALVKAGLKASYDFVELLLDE
jgi:hypothetical protein